MLIFYHFIYHRFCIVSEALYNADFYKELLSFLDEVAYLPDQHPWKHSGNVTVSVFHGTRLISSYLF